MTTPADAEIFGPTPAPQRIVSVDVVRGFALWGVLLINMMNFGALIPGQWPDPLDQFAFWAQRFFFEQKSLRLFSFLFGLGFALKMLRASDGGAPFLPVYVRRLAVLSAFGFLHYLINPADVLVPYVIVGLALLFFRDWLPPRILVLVALLFLIHPVVGSVWPEHRATPRAPQVNPIARLYLRVPDPIYRQNIQRASSVLEHVRVRAQRARDIWRARAKRFPSTHLDPRDHWRGSQSWLVYLAMFLLGLYAGKRRIFHDVHTHRALITRIFYYGLPLGMLAMTADWIFRDFGPRPLPPVAWFLRETIWVYGATALSLSYAAGLLLLIRRPQWHRRLFPLAAMGRVALTVYVTQSIIFTTLFLDYGFDLQRRVGPAGVFAYAAVIYAAQLGISVWWMRRFRFGPLEWLWRMLTYARRQPMRLPRGETAGAGAEAERALP
jgi:uncharacterized protein